MIRKHIYISIICFMALIFSLTSCSGGKSLTSGDVTKENVDQICGIIDSAGLSNSTEFKEWVAFANGEAAAGGDEEALFNDADCRMTVMLLAGDSIKYDSVEENYSGDYLMFDTNLIENEAKYAILKEKEKLFTTMFGEMPYSESGFEKGIAERWNKHGIVMDNDRASVISIQFKTYGKNEAFVGHTGILIDCKDIDAVDSNYIFVEKIAFGEPFVITLLDEESELLSVLSKRADYFGTEEGDPTPVVYKNAEPMGVLEAE